MNSHHRHYRNKPSNNDLALKTDQLRRARRRRVMSIKRVTFSVLKDLFIESCGHGDSPATSSIANHVSALGDFLKDMGFEWRDEVRELLRKQFQTACNGHAQRLAAKGRPRSYVKNRCSLLNNWFRFLRSLDYEGASITGDLTPWQQALRPLLAGSGIRDRAARAIGVSAGALVSWSRDGRMPHRSHEPNVTLLEQFFGLAPGSLLDLIPRRRKSPSHTTENKIPNHYRERLAERSKVRYRLKARKVPLDHRLRVQMPALVRYKVEGKSSASIRRSRGMILGRTLRSTGEKSWRTRELRAHWKSDKSRAKRWPEILDDRWVPTASRTWNELSAFFGWSMISLSEGGAGLPIEELTLGLLVDQDHLFRYLDWWAENSGQIHSGHLYFLDMVLMLVHAEDGFLPKQAAIGAALGFDAEAWRARCVATMDWIYQEIRPALQEGYQHDGKARNSFEPIRLILNLERPLDALMRAIIMAEAERPATGGAHEVAWARDIALMALLISNPLRILNLIGLTYLPDNTGQLRQDPDGSWRIFIDKRLFKNLRGAAREHDYDQAIDPTLATYIARYLRTYRPLIGGARPDLVFVSTDHPDREFDKLDGVVRTWTKRYLENCAGIGPHHIRHIVATHIVKTTLGNYFLAAIALHDSVTTVKKSYDQFLPSYGDAGRLESYRLSMSLLKGAARTRVLAAREMPAEAVSNEGDGTEGTDEPEPR